MVEGLPMAGCKNQRRRYCHYHGELMQGQVHPLSKLSLVSGDIEVIRAQDRGQAGWSLRDQQCFWRRNSDVFQVSVNAPSILNLT